MTESRRPMEGCPEFDERLIDLVAEPFAPPELEAHLATCDDCRDALAGYRDTGRAIAAAFTTLGGCAESESVPTRTLRPHPITLAAAALFFSVTAWMLRTPTPDSSSATPVTAALAPSPATLAVAAHYDAIVSLVGPTTARIEEGTSTFVIRDGRSVVETPIGPLSCDDCEFTVQVRSCADGSFPTDLAALASRCVTVSVSQGRLGTHVLDQSLMMDPGQSVTWPMTAECVPMPHARIPGVFQ